MHERETQRDRQHLIRYDLMPEVRVWRSDLVELRNNLLLIEKRNIRAR